MTSTTGSQTYVSDGPELWYVESDALTIESPDGQLTLQAGESRLLDAAEGFSVFFIGDSCASALRLVVAPVFGMVVRALPTVPRCQREAALTVWSPQS